MANFRPLALHSPDLASGAIAPVEALVTSSESLSLSRLLIESFVFTNFTRITFFFCFPALWRHSNTKAIHRDLALYFTSLTNSRA